MNDWQTALMVGLGLGVAGVMGVHALTGPEEVTERVITEISAPQPFCEGPVDGGWAERVRCYGSTDITYFCEEGTSLG